MYDRYSLLVAIFSVRLTSFIYNYLGVRSVFPVLADEQELIARRDPETAVGVLLFELSAQIYVAVVKKFFHRSVGKRVFRIYERAAKREKFCHLGHIFDVKRVKFRDRPLYKLAKSGFPAAFITFGGNTSSPERMTVRGNATVAFFLKSAVFAIRSAN